jgi:hypothetical protein
LCFLVWGVSIEGSLLQKGCHAAFFSQKKAAQRKRQGGSGVFISSRTSLAEMHNPFPPSGTP